MTMSWSLGATTTPHHGQAACRRHWSISMLAGERHEGQGGQGVDEGGRSAGCVYPPWQRESSMTPFIAMHGSFLRIVGYLRPSCLLTVSLPA